MCNVYPVFYYLSATVEIEFYSNRKNRAHTVWTCAELHIVVVIVDGGTPIKHLVSCVDALSSIGSVVTKRKVARCVLRISASRLGNDSICSRVLVCRIYCEYVKNEKREILWTSLVLRSWTWFWLMLFPVFSASTASQNAVVHFSWSYIAKLLR